MRPFVRSIPRDLRFALQCLAAAALTLTLTLAPLARLAPTEEPLAVPCALSDDLALELLSRTLAAELGERSYAAQIALGAALCNRLADPRYPNELGAVIIDAGLHMADDEIPTRSRRAAEVALMGVDPTGGALHWGDAVKQPTVEFDHIPFGP